MPVVALLAALPCCGPPYSATPSFDRPLAVHVGELTAAGGMFTGSFGRAPLMTNDLAARCVDESICEAAVIDHHAVVAGKRPGQTEIALEYVASKSGEAAQAHLSVTVLPRTTGTLEAGPGKTEPDGEVFLLPDVRPADGEPVPYLCARSEAFSPGGGAPSGGELGRTAADLFTCVGPTKLPSGQRYWARPGAPWSMLTGWTAGDQVLTCIDRKIPGGEVTALWIYRMDKQYRFALVDKRGAPGKTCSPSE